MEIKKLLFIGLCLSTSMLIRVNGQNRTTSEASERLNRQTSEIIANREPMGMKITNEISTVRLDEMNELLYKRINEQLAAKMLLYPAEELYLSNWDTVHVNPFYNQTISFPDSCSIDCTTFTMPLDLPEIKINSPYGPRRRRMHYGIDLGLQLGDTIYAAFDGKVRIKSFERRGYGNYLVLRHPNGLETVYGHLSKFLVTENQTVRSGQPIGLGGRTGRATGTHLHFETRFLGKDINPAEIIDFENGTPHLDHYVFYNIKINGKKSNLYATSPDAVAIHRVKSGETLGVIARNYGTTVDELCLLNGISRTSTLSIGQAIQVRGKQTKVEAPKQTEGTIQLVSEEINGITYHTIQSGDTLSSIAKKYGTTIEKLCELNDIQKNLILRPGKKIRCS